MTQSLNTCISNSILSPGSIDSNICQNPQFKSEGNSFPILNTKSTDFASVLWSQQQPKNPCQQQTSTNGPIVSNNLACLKMKGLGPESINRTNNILLPVITPPPQISLPVGPSSNPSPNLNTNFRIPQSKRSGPARLNKFVRRLHEMLLSEQSSGIVEWRKGLLVLHSTDAFTKQILPKYFGTKNFKTFRRQLNYYGFVHVRSFSATGTTTTALWVNQDLAKRGTKSISSVLMLKRVEPSESSKTAEGRRVRKEEAASTVEDIGISTRAIQLEQIRLLASKDPEQTEDKSKQGPSLPLNVAPHSTIVNCQVSQNGTESTISNTSSMGSTSLPPVPASINVTYPYSTSVTPTLESLKKGSVLQQTSCSKDTTTDDAANLLIMLSKSACQIQD